MAATLPAQLKIPEIARFATRAAQLEKFKPIVSYWLNYYVVNQILSKGLHTADDECMTYTTTLMDKLETVKTENAGNDAITDDVAAKAYVEQFALETFQRGDDQIHSNQASRQTIDTFQAAATFLDVLAVWGPLDPEIAAKVKYAKYHAVRIAKAIKAGEDPNASNPVDEDIPAATPAPEAGLESDHLNAAYRPPTVESAPDSKQPSRPSSIAPGSPMAPPPVLPTATASGPPPEEAGVSPIEPADANPRQSSVGGGYFPEAPTFTSETAAPSIPTAGSDTLMNDFTATPSDYYNQPSAPPAPAPAPAPAPQPARAPIPAPQPQPIPVGGYRTDDESIMMAQKHAKWANSALNFEDVETAVKELRLALQSLGAS